MRATDKEHITHSTPPHSTVASRRYDLFQKSRKNGSQPLFSSSPAQLMALLPHSLFVEPLPLLPHPSSSRTRTDTNTQRPRTNTCTQRSFDVGSSFHSVADAPKCRIVHPRRGNVRRASTVRQGKFCKQCAIDNTTNCASGVPSCGVSPCTSVCSTISVATLSEVRLWCTPPV